MENWSIGKSATLTDLSMCINRYRMMTVGLYACLRVGVKLGNQLSYPDMIVMIGHGRKKQCEPDFEQNHFKGPPNFVLDIHSDVNAPFIQNRKKLFSREGVAEYLVVNEELTMIEWNRLEGNHFTSVDPDQEGLIKSTSLPGLWVPVDALKKRDFWAVMASIEHGITRRDHHQLMESIWNKN